MEESCWPPGEYKKLSSLAWGDFREQKRIERRVWEGMPNHEAAKTARGKARWGWEIGKGFSIGSPQTGNQQMKSRGVGVRVR